MRQQRTIVIEVTCYWNLYKYREGRRVYLVPSDVEIALL